MILKKLTWNWQYTSSTVPMAIASTNQYLLGGNLEKLLKKVLYLKKKNMKFQRKIYLNKNQIFLKPQKVPAIYAQANRPISPLCYKCPLKKNCISLKKNDFNIKSKKNPNKIKKIF